VVRHVQRRVVAAAVVGQHAGPRHHQVDARGRDVRVVRRTRVGAHANPRGRRVDRAGVVGRDVDEGVRADEVGGGIVDETPVRSDLHRAARGRYRHVHHRQDVSLRIDVVRQHAAVGGDDEPRVRRRDVAVVRGDGRRVGRRHLQPHRGRRGTAAAIARGVGEPVRPHESGVGSVDEAPVLAHEQQRAIARTAVVSYLFELSRSIFLLHKKYVLP